MADILIVYHSRTNWTRRVARMLARRLDADLEEIAVARPIGGPLGYALCAIEALAGIPVSLRPMHKDPANYDFVVVGTPVWFWRLSSPVLGWLRQHRLRKGRAAFFCTMGGSGATRVFATMEELSGARPVATLAVTDDEIDSRRIEGLVDFVRAVRLAASPVEDAGAPRSAGRRERHRTTARAGMRRKGEQRIATP